MSTQTPVDDSTPLSDSSDQTSQEPPETVESLKAKLAATEAKKLKAEEDAATWKGRVKDENPPKEKRKVDPDEEYSDWRIDNKDRISLVKDGYEKELSELQDGGMKVTLSMREKALRLAEASAGVKTAPKTEPLPGGMIDRGGQREPLMTKEDIAFGVKPETKKKYAHLVEE